MTDLPTRRLGRTDLAITPVGIGTAPISSHADWRIYWGAQDRAESIRSIHAALDLGVNWIDTAPFYGWGRGESIVGEAIKGRRDQVYVFTKCGTLRARDGSWYESLQPESIRREVENSLRTLQTDYIDLYQFHDPDPLTPIEDSWAEMQKLIAEGKVRYGGLSNHSTDLMERAQAIAPIASNQHEFSLLNRAIEADALPYSRQNGIGVLAWGPLAGGFLAHEFDLSALDPADFRLRHPRAREPLYGQIRHLVHQLHAIAQRYGKSATDLAIAWILSRPGLSGAIVGIRSAKEARQMTGALGLTLSQEELKAIDVDLARVGPFPGP